MTLSPNLAAELGLEMVAEDVYVRPMTTLNRAADEYLGEVGRRLRPRTQHTYSRVIDSFVDAQPPDLDVAKVTSADLGRFLDRYKRNERGTQAQVFSILRCFWEWTRRNGYIKRSPMENMLAPRKLPAEALDVVTLSSEDVRRLLGAAQGWTEKLSVALPAYMGCRRRAAAQLRVKDYDPSRRSVRFREKGGKTIWKPVPDELAVMLDARLKDCLTSSGNGGPTDLVERGSLSASGRDGAAGAATEARKRDPRTVKAGPQLDTRTGCAVLAAEVAESSPITSPLLHGSDGPTSGPGSLTPGPDDYLIPSEHTARNGERDDRVVWKAVRRAADRAGIDRCHVHALRAAFAVFYLESNHGDLEALQPLMGHRSLATTQVYLRRLERETAMERVRDLSWA